MKKSLFAILLIPFAVVLLQACHIGTSGSWQNDHIDATLRDKMSVLNDQLFKALTTNDIATVKGLMSPTLVDKLGKKTDTIVNAVAATNATEYTVLDQYYTKNSTTDIANTLMSLKGNNNDYKIQYQALNKEMYVSVLVSKNLPENFLAFAVYGKYDETWKLNILYIGEHDVLGKTAPDYYKTASDEYHKGNIIDAADLMVIASQLADPANKHLQYNCDEEMKNFYTSVIKEANTTYKFPITINQIKTTPQIFAINPQVIAEKGHEGIYPFIQYKSNIALNDTVALKDENKQLQKIIGTVFKGIDQNNKFIIYKVYQELPVFNSSYDPHKPVKQYGFVQKL